MSKTEETIVFISRPTCPYCVQLKQIIDEEGIENKLLKNNFKFVILYSDNEKDREIYKNEYKIPDPQYVPYLYYLKMNKKNDKVFYKGHEIEDRNLLLNLKINDIRTSPKKTMDFNQKYLKYKSKYLSAK
jgi:glutaredoxin